MSFLSFLPLVGQVLGGVLGNRSQRRAEQSNIRAAQATRVENDRRTAIARQETITDRQNMFSDLRSSAVQGGFNPLTALQMTGGAGFGSGSSSPSLSLVANLPMVQPKDYSWMSNVGQGLQDIATNRLGYEMADRQLGLDLQKAQIRVLDRQASQPLALGSQRTSSVSNVRGVSGVGVNPNITPVVEPYMTTSGNVVRVPVGPDIDEVISGTAINVAGSSQDYYADNIRPIVDFVGGSLNNASEISRRLDAKFWSLFNSNVVEVPNSRKITVRPNPYSSFSGGGFND